MVTDKYNRMIESFECDFNLVVTGEKSLSELEDQIKNGEPRILKDIELLNELSFLLRHGKAEINLLP